MNNLYKYILENVSSKKIEKQVAIKILEMLKQEKLSQPKEDIAIIGMSAKFPMAENTDIFWENLCNQVDCIREFPSQRSKSLLGGIKSIWRNTEDSKFSDGAYFDDIDKFDYKFFHITPNEAALMDPNQKIFLQVVWQAIEDAGYGGDMLRGSKTGIFLGHSSDFGEEYKRYIQTIAPASMALSITGNIKSIIASRISYLLDLKGPSMLIDTACSSTLVAVHEACRSIRNKECEIAIVGGVKIHLFPFKANEQQSIGIESSDGKTKTFDNGSDGTGIGEGAAAILLKPLVKAVRDKDNIIAVIKGSAINQDGNSIGITAPNSSAQKDVLVQAWQDAKIDPQSISYIEAHGTGTRLGDPIEMDGLETAFKEFSKNKQYCAIGSVKTNIGHLDHMAGMAGLIKTVLMLKNKKIPPLIHFRRPNRQIKFQCSPFYVNDQLIPWETEFIKRRCGVSSFGLSGTNCHLVLEEYIPEEDTESVCSSTDMNIFTLSAKSEESLNNLLKSYYSFLCSNKKHDLLKLCYTANIGRGHYQYRVAMVVNNLESLTSNIGKLVAGGVKPLTEQRIWYGIHHLLADGSDRMHSGDIFGYEKNNMCKQVDKIVDEYLLNNNSYIHLENICQHYVQGAEVDWNNLYRDKQTGRISLPVYQFDNTTAWVNTEDEKCSVSTSPDNYKPQTVSYYTTKWINEDLPRLNNDSIDGCIVVFKDQVGCSEYLIEKLRNQQKTVIEVERGISYRKVTDIKYVIGSEQEDYELLFEQIKGFGTFTMLHLFTYGKRKAAKSLDELDKNLEWGVYSLYYIHKVVHMLQIEQANILIVSECVNNVTTDDEIVPENAPLFAIGKVINTETAILRCRCVDIDYNTSKENILEEMSAATSDYCVSYRDNRRYLPELSEVDLPDYPDSGIEIKKRGVYVITGGTGGIGLEIAKYLASQNQVNLVLINRSKIPDRKEWEKIAETRSNTALREKTEAIRDIEDSGSSITCYNADISDMQKMQDIISEITDRYKIINGVIHSAGVNVGEGGTLLIDKDKDEFAREMLAKVHGTWVLDFIFSNVQLDFLAVFTSPITIIGGAGMGPYTCSNTYLNSYSEYAVRKGKKVFAIGWAPWEKTVQKMGNLFNQKKQLFEILSTNDLVESFKMVISKDMPVLTAGKINYKSGSFLFKENLPRLSDDIKRHIDEIFLQAPDTEFIINEIVMSGSECNQYSDTERNISRIFCEIMGLKEINIHDNIYELGGDSIFGMKMINRVNNTMSLNITITELLRNFSVSKFSEYLDNKYLNNREVQITEVIQPIVPIIQKEYYETSSAQKRMYLLNKVEDTGLGYNITVVQYINGELDKNQFEKAFAQLVERHESFRTSFHVINEEIVQKIHPQVEVKMNYLEVNGEGHLLEESINKEIRNFVKVFDLEQAPLIRSLLIRINQYIHVFVYDVHHIVFDGFSINILQNDLLCLYRNRPLPELDFQYKDYSEWQSRYLAGDTVKRQEKYWLGLFNGDIPKVEIPTDFKRPAIRSNQGDVVKYVIDKELATELKHVAINADTTLHMLLLSAFYVLLYKYTGQEDIIVGSPIAGRNHNGLESVIGMFVNALAYRNFPNGKKKFRFFMQEVIKNVLSAYDNQEYPFNELVKNLKLQRDLSRNQLFDVSFIMQNIQWKLKNEDSDLIFSYLPYKSLTSKNDITLEVLEANNSIEFSFEYCTSIFRRESIERMVTSFVKILGEVVTNPEKTLEDIDILATNEMQQVLDDFNVDL